MPKNPFIDDEAKEDNAVDEEEGDSDIEELGEVSTPTKFTKSKDSPEKEASVPWRESVTNALTAHFSTHVHNIETYANVTWNDKASLVYHEFWNEEIQIPWNKMKQLLNKESGRLVIFCPQKLMMKLMRATTAEVLYNYFLLFILIHFRTSCFTLTSGSLLVHPLLLITSSLSQLQLQVLGISTSFPC